jgi:hypothetical protein
MLLDFLRKSAPAGSVRELSEQMQAGAEKATFCAGRLRLMENPVKTGDFTQI